MNSQELRARFAGGAVGFLGYDMVRFFEPTVAPPTMTNSGYRKAYL
jgi:hypothetical protein